jgi:hypothetical protein
MGNKELKSVLELLTKKINEQEEAITLIQKLLESQTQTINKLNQISCISCETKSDSDFLQRVSFNPNNPKSNLTITQYRLNKLKLLKKPTEFVLQVNF